MTLRQCHPSNSQVTCSSHPNSCGRTPSDTTLFATSPRGCVGTVTLGSTTSSLLFFTLFSLFCVPQATRSVLLSVTFSSSPGPLERSQAKWTQTQPQRRWMRSVISYRTSSSAHEKRLPTTQRLAFSCIGCGFSIFSNYYSLI